MISCAQRNIVSINHLVLRSWLFQHPENQPEFPVVERTYFIQFMFPEETSLKTEEVPVDVEAMADDMADMATMTGEGADTGSQEEEGEQVWLLGLWWFRSWNQRNLWFFFKKFSWFRIEFYKLLEILLYKIHMLTDWLIHNHLHHILSIGIF